MNPLTRTSLLTASLALALVAAAPACGDSTPNNPDYGQPPAPPYDTGNGAAGDGYGSGNGGTGFVCPDELKRCPMQFTFPFGGETSVELRGSYRDGAWDKGDAMTHAGDTWSVTVDVPWNVAVQYKLLVDGTTWVLDPNDPNVVTDASGNKNNVTQPLTCVAPSCAEPPLPPPGVYDWRDAVVYFVFVDRFFDGDKTNDCTVAGADPAGSYEGGDWAGVKQKIDSGYFDDLGVNTLWLTVPVLNTHDAGQGTGGDTHYYSGYHGYWPKELDQQESCFGTMQELQDLVAAAHAHHLKVLFDYAMVHVHITSSIYAQNPGWFWPNEKNGGDCICGQNCSWDTDYQRCWFTSYLPHWNYTVAAARDYSVNAAVTWAKKTGADGFRLDAIKHVDVSWLTQLRAQVQSTIVPLQTPPQRFYMVGETYDFENRDFIKSFVDPSAKLDGQFDFPLRKRLTEAVIMRRYTGMNDLAAYMDGNEFYYGVSAVMSTFVGNHDLPRIIHLAEDVPMWADQAADGKDRSWSNQPQLPGYRAPFERVANAFAVLFTNRGAPLVYYGDEIGLPGAGDPDNRRTMTFTGWTADQQYLHDRVKALLAIRAAHPALRRGHRATLAASADVWVYSQTTTGDTVYVAINRGDAQQSIDVLPSQPLSELLTGTSVTGPNAVLPPRQARVFVAK